MGRVYKTTQGKSIDMDSIRLVNEKTIAIGNMRVNAAGDQLGAGGAVVRSRNQAMDQQYQINNRSHDQRAFHTEQAQQRQGVASAQGQAAPQQYNTAPAVPEVDPSGVAFDPPEESHVDIHAEPQLRGSLADSIAKSVTVTQELLDPRPTAAKGPQRI
jgi:hypothetical protein